MMPILLFNILKDRLAVDPLPNLYIVQSGVVLKHWLPYHLLSMKCFCKAMKAL